MTLSLSVAILTHLRLIALRCLPKQTQLCQPLSGVIHVSRSHGMFFLKPLIFARHWLFLLSLALLALIHTSADATCLSPDPYAVSSDSSLDLVQTNGCTLESLSVGAGITLSSTNILIDNSGTIRTITNNGTIAQ